jgi:tripeptide aminopeptidase
VVEGELRSTSDDKLEKEKRKIIEVFQTAAGECGCQIEIAEELSFSSFGIDPGSEGAILLAKAMRDCGVEPNFVSTGGGSDANIFNQDNLAMMTVNVGMVGAHSKDEYILKEDLSTVARILTRLIRLAAGAEH